MTPQIYPTFSLDIPNPSNSCDALEQNHRIHRPDDLLGSAEFAGSSVDSLLAFSSHSSQPWPNSSTGCCVRIVPLPQRRSSAEQYFSQPQQILSGCFGFSANFGFDVVILSRIVRVFVRQLTLVEQQCPAGVRWLRGACRFYREPSCAVIY